eukprot:scaffold576_cov260-Pinguiococcus_pyrenoidosus.AAC.118
MQLLLKHLYTGEVATQSLEEGLDIVALAGAWGLRDLEDFMASQVAAMESAQRGGRLLRSPAPTGSAEQQRRVTRLSYRAQDALRADMKELARRVLDGDPSVTAFADCFVSVAKGDIHGNGNGNGNGNGSGGGDPGAAHFYTEAEDAVVFAMHRCFLCSNSQYFRGALLGEFSEAKDATVHLLDTTADVFRYVVEWIYSDQWAEPPAPEEALRIIELASRLMMPRLATFASSVVGPCIDNDNVVGCLRFARVHSLVRLERSCVKHIALNVADICASEESGLQDLIREEIRSVEQRGDVRVTDVPLVADIRNVLNEHYGRLASEQKSHGEEAPSESSSGEATVGEAKETNLGQSGAAAGTSGFKGERECKHDILDLIVAEALQAEHDCRAAEGKQHRHDEAT